MDINAPIVLDFWFDETTRPLWFAAGESFDRVIAERFGTLLQQAAAGELVSWRNLTAGRVAEIIVLDQFSRNVWRDTLRAFSQDGMALVLAQEVLKQADFAALPVGQQKFALMPYMHSESAAIHAEAVPLFTALGDELTLDFELRHKAIIDRFGCYPHRNAILGRVSRAEEEAFLQQAGSSF